MSTISLKFGVHTRDWPRIDFQSLEFNFELFFFGGGSFCLISAKSHIVGLHIKLKTCSGPQKIHSK